MKNQVNQKYRLYRRQNGTYYYEDCESGKQLSLKTKDKAEALRLLNAHNEKHQLASLNGQIGRIYLNARDPELNNRTWAYAFEELSKLKQGNTRIRWERAILDPAFDSIRKIALVDTRAEHFFKVLGARTVSTNVFLRRVHNFALGLGWLPWPVLPPKQWPRPQYKEKRAITEDEHKRILANEHNEERRAFYEALWEIGGSQSDVAFLTHENIDWNTRTIHYFRQKTKQLCQLRFGAGGDLEKLLGRLPSEGPLFPYLRTVREADRATEFKQRCTRLGIKGVTLHCYRYSWAERARECGYPERYAQAALGHGSKAVARAYAKKANPTIPSLDEWKKQKAENVVSVEFPKSAPNANEGNLPREKAG